MNAYKSSALCILVLFLVFNESYARYKANKKCAEYSKLSANLRKTGHGFSDDDSQNTNEEFPHMVALGFGENGNFSWSCGGTVISENYILTAAHCTYSAAYGIVKAVHVGSINLNNGGVNLQIAKIIRHPAYKVPSVYNDIALLQLKNIIRFSRSVLPACLNTLNRDSDVGSTTKLVATGWGVLTFGGPPSDDLLKVELRLSTPRECNISYSNSNIGRKLPQGIDSSTQLCAGGGPNQKDTCQGDSGGPLGMKTGELFTVVGIISFGRSCGVANVPSIYTRVSAYVRWIEQNVWP